MNKSIKKFIELKIKDIFKWRIRSIAVFELILIEYRFLSKILVCQKKNQLDELFEVKN